MQYVSLGRKLGRGTRAAAKVLRAQTGHAIHAARAKAPELAAQSRNVARGGRGFRRGIWKPFTHAIRMLWHEITGVFFALFAVFFGQGAWRVRSDWHFGPDHRHFIVYLIVMLLFVYFSITAFSHSRRAPR